MRIITTMLLVLSAALLYGCPSPDAQKKVQEAARVPGLEESVLAKDRSLQAAIEISWKSDVELLQEQLAVEEVRAGKVRITGIVSSEKLKERAENIAKNQEGVVDVISTIKVDESLKDSRFSLDNM